MCVITPRGTYEENGTEKTATWTFLDEVTVLQGKNPLSEPEESGGESISDSSGSSSVSSVSIGSDGSGVSGANLDSGAETAATGGTSPSTGDKGLVLAAILGGSALAAIALVGRRRT